MSILVAIILGLVQGATEFIPVSSSGHLIIARQILGQNVAGGLAFDAVLQLATSFAVLVYFRKDVLNIIKNTFDILLSNVVEQREKTLIYGIILGTIPAVIFGLLLESKMDTVFRSTHLVAVTLILGSILFYFAQKYAGQEELTVTKAVKIGFFQCLALIPGVSRSGATISGGLFSGLTKESAVRFSFLLSLPILFGTGFKKLFEVREMLGTEFGLSLLVGCIVAFITGLLAINFLIKYLKNNNLNLFIWYRIILALVILFFF